VIEMIHALNLKSGFRKRARALGLPVVPGAECRDHAEQRAACEALLDEHEAVLIKLDRSSNGYGHLRVTRGDRDAGRLSARLQQHARAFDAQPAATVVEAWLSLRSAPSLELRVDDEGPTVLYECDQLSRGIGSAAMVTPSRTLSPTARAAMLDWGRRFGEYLAGQGYRGVFDLDLAWTTDDALFVSEVNVRRTAGTHLYELVERLVGPGGAKAWVGDCRPSDTPSSFEEGQRRLKREGLAFDPDAGHGVVLTADSIDRGGLWRYVVIGESADHVDELERRLATILQFRQERAA
ncbi:MAG: hypothetical protein K0V04_12975, partial [Deltaproteobacteria bacterium]|nr:hypothetical protein [Deltaproteobacteria bacterium]